MHSFVKTNIVAILALLATLVIAYVTYFNFRHTTTGERPELRFHFDELFAAANPNDSSSDRSFIRYSIINVGSRTARRVEVRSGFHLATSDEAEPDPHVFLKNAPFEPRPNLASKEEHGTFGYMYNPDKSNITLYGPDLVNGRKIFYFLAHIRYIDLSDETHNTWACVHAVPFEGRLEFANCNNPSSNWQD
jgi:hypothetical protein